MNRGYQCSGCREIFDESRAASVHNRLRHGGTAKIYEVDKDTTHVVTSPAKKPEHSLTRTAYETHGYLKCDCPYFRREAVCSHVAQYVADKLDTVELENDYETVLVPLFVEPPVVADVEFMRDGPDESEMWNATLPTPDWASYPYKNVKLGIVTRGVSRSTLRYLILAWLVSEDEKWGPVSHDDSSPRCYSEMHPAGPETRPGEEGSKERLADLWFRLHYSKCAHCYAVEKAAAV